MARIVLKRLYIDWTGTGSSYTDESARLISANGSMRLAPPEDSILSPRGITDQCTLILNNNDGRYSSLNSSGALYTYLQNGGAYHAPMYLEISVDNGSNYYRQFTGVIKIPKENAPTWSESSTVTIDCRSKDEKLLWQKLSTTTANFASYYDTGKTEAEIIEAWLLAAGVTSGEMTLDIGNAIIPFAWLDDESPMEDIWMIAAAAGGRFYVDPDGEYRYENVAHWATHTSSTETFAPQNYQRLTPEWRDAELYSSITAEAAPRSILGEDVLWESDEVITVPPGQTRTVTAKMRQPAYSISSIEATPATGGGADLSTDISVSNTNYAQRVVIDITNNNTVFTAYVNYLAVKGKAVSGRPNIESTATSTNAFWTSRADRVRALRGNPYIQNGWLAESLALFLLARQELPRLFWRIAGAVGYPSRRLGERVTIYDENIMNATRDAFITAITWRLDDKGLVHDVECIDAENYFGSVAYFKLGTHTLNGSVGVF